MYLCTWQLCSRMPHVETSPTSLPVCRAVSHFTPYGGHLPIFFSTGRDSQLISYWVSGKVKYLTWKEGMRGLLNGTLLKRHLSLCWWLCYLNPIYRPEKTYILSFLKKLQTGWYRHVYHYFLLNFDCRRCHFFFPPIFFPFHPGLAAGTSSKKLETWVHSLFCFWELKFILPLMVYSKTHSGHSPLFLLKFHL